MVPHNFTHLSKTRSHCTVACFMVKHIQNNGIIHCQCASAICTSSCSNIDMCSSWYQPASAASPTCPRLLKLHTTVACFMGKHMQNGLVELYRSQHTCNKVFCYDSCNRKRFWPHISLHLFVPKKIMHNSPTLSCSHFHIISQPFLSR